jgi:hypothetical protein
VQLGSVQEWIKIFSASAAFHPIDKRTLGRFNPLGVVNSMDYLEKILEKLREWAQQLIDSLLEPQIEPEPELIPIPTGDRRR